MIFSIIVPAKNEEKNILRLLQSIQNIDFSKGDFEVIVIDNGSNDRTVDIASQLNARVYIKPDLTISGLRNHGSSVARGQYLVFIDADCSVSANWLKKASQIIAKDGIVCFGCPPRIPDDATWVQNAWFHIRGPQSGLVEVSWLESMNMFVRKDIFELVGGFNEKLKTCEDYDLSLRLGAQGKIYSDSDLNAVHHGEASTVSHFFKKELWRGTSNRQGFFSHRFSLKELPSILVPLVYCCIHFLFFVSLILFHDHYVALLTLYIFFLVMPSTLYAFVKVRQMQSFLSVLQLSFLMNVYFCARGISIFLRR